MAVAHTEYGWWSDLNWSPSVQSPSDNQIFNDTFGKDLNGCLRPFVKSTPDTTDMI